MVHLPLDIVSSCFQFLPTEQRVQGTAICQTLNELNRGLVLTIEAPGPCIHPDRFCNLRSFQGCFSTTNEEVQTLLLHCAKMEVLLLRGCQNISSETINMLVFPLHHSARLRVVDVAGTKATFQQIKLLLEQYCIVGMDARFVQQSIWHDDVNWQRISLESLCLACCKSTLWDDVHGWRTHPSISPINMGNIQRSMPEEWQSFLHSKPFQQMVIMLLRQGKRDDLSSVCSRGFRVQELIHHDIIPPSWGAHRGVPIVGCDK